jgi:hypothetical protein
MNTRDIRELSDADLDIVSGGWKQCLNGTTSGGGAGLYPDNVTCAPTLGEVITETATKLRETLRGGGSGGGGGGGRPA